MYHALDRIQREGIEVGFRYLSLEAFTSHGAPESLSGLAQQFSHQFRDWMRDRQNCGCDEMSTAPETTEWKDSRPTDNDFAK
jgi:hypothetical protein